MKRLNRKDIHLWDHWFARSVQVASIGLLVLLAAIGFYLFRGSLPSIEHFGFQFFTQTIWDPAHEEMGVLSVLYGTLVSSLIAILISAPLSVGVALFLAELAPPAINTIIGFLVEMLAAVPSVVYGLWGIFALVPWLRGSVEPLLWKCLGFLPFFQGPRYGVGMLAAGVILAIMITPTVFSITREVFKSVPQYQREAALALGATRWEMMKISVLQASKRGVWGAIILGLGRALGETMAVTMVIGNRPDISLSFFAPAQTMASVIANEYAEASTDLHLSALIHVGLTLFVVTFLINLLTRVFVLKRPGAKL